MKSMNTVRLGVLGAVLSLAMLAGCATETGETSSTSEPTQTLQSTFEELTVDGEVRADGTVAAEVRNRSGVRVLSLVVGGDVARVELIGAAGPASGTFTVPPDPEGRRTLARWNAFAEYLAHALPETRGDAPASPGVAPRMRRGRGCSIFDVCCAGGTVCDALAQAWWEYS